MLTHKEESENRCVTCDFVCTQRDLKLNGCKRTATKHEKLLEKIASMTQRLADGLVPEPDIEAVTALRDGMQYGVDILRVKEYDSGNSRREAIMAQREKRRTL